jgi:hypothetical protein
VAEFGAPKIPISKLLAQKPLMQTVTCYLGPESRVAAATGPVSHVIVV